MNTTLRVWCVIGTLLITAHRLPAPISEVEQTPTPRPSVSPESKSKKTKPVATEPKSASRFNGTWKRQSSLKDANGNVFTETRTLIITGGKSAEFILEKSGVLSQGKKWAGFTEPYNSLASIHTKWVDKAAELKSDGSNLKIYWPGATLVDWNPKTIPLGVFKSGTPSSALYVLDGNQLISTDGKNTGTYVRAK